MTIQRAIELLQALKEKHGDVELLMDCPHCNKALRPTVVAAVAVIQVAPTR